MPTQKSKNKSTKKERFKRLASYRTNEILKKLRTLGNCSNRSFYSYTEVEIEKIFEELERKLIETKAQFTFSRTKKFKL